MSSRMTAARKFELKQECRRLLDPLIRRMAADEVFEGEFRGAGEQSKAMDFCRKHMSRDAFNELARMTGWSDQGEDDEPDDYEMVEGEDDEEPEPEVSFGEDDPDWPGAPMSGGRGFQSGTLGGRYAGDSRLAMDKAARRMRNEQRTLSRFPEMRRIKVL